MYDDFGEEQLSILKDLEKINYKNNRLKDFLITLTSSARFETI